MAERLRGAGSARRNEDVLSFGLTPPVRRRRPPPAKPQTLQTALMIIISVSLITMYVYTMTTDTEMIASQSQSKYAARGAKYGVRPFSEEHLVIAFAKPTDLTQAPPASKKWAYVYYVTEDAYACMAMHSMDRLVNALHMDTSRIEFLVLHVDGVAPYMIKRTQTEFNARTIQVEKILADVADPTWQESLTKLRAFEEFGYDRIVFMDSDAVPVQNLDDLFLLPSAPLYAPTAYWLAQPFFTTTLMVIEPSNESFKDIIRWANTRSSESLGYDMDILNGYFKSTAKLLPAVYSVLNSDFRARPEARNALFPTTLDLQRHAKLVHFSCRPDGSYGKPWLVDDHDLSFLQREGIDPFFGELFENFWRSIKRFCI